MIKHKEGKMLCKSLCDLYENDISRSEKNMSFFIEILNYFKKKSNIEFSIRTYKDFQENINIRKGLHEILNNYDLFAKLLNPIDNILHIRIKCPVCNEYDKSSKSLQIIKDQNGNYMLKSFCNKHGDYSVNLNDKNDYVDVNTQLRDLLKGYIINRNQNVLTIMMDGSDWGGTWSNRIHCEGLLHLGEQELPLRIFTPMILDWSGAKFSKSLYMKNKDYENINNAFNDYTEFKRKYSDAGMNLLWSIACDWVGDPKKFYRNLLGKLSLIKKL